MTKYLIVSVLNLLGCAAFAYDSDPGYGVRGDSSTVRVNGRSKTPVSYYKPTMRYYGKGYVVAYRYVQWNDRMSRAGTTFTDGSVYNLPTTPFQQSTPGTSPRVTYYYGAQPSAPTAVKSEQESVVASPAKVVPPITGDAVKK